MQNTTTAFGREKLLHRDPVVFGLLWIVVFALYYPAARAGFVADFTGWLEQEKFHGFWDNINRTGYQVHSLYQFTQFVTWVCYHLFGINEWAWHLLFITLHTINAWLTYKVTATLLNDTGVANGKTISLAGALLFSVSPYISEVLVWEPSFHFLQGLLLVLLALLCVQRYVHSGSAKYAWWAVTIYALSVFSLELFYITPWLVLSLGFFYDRNSLMGQKIWGSVARNFFLPMLLLFAARLLLFRLVYGDWVSRIGSGAVASVQSDSFAKPAKYLYHLVAMGRFMPHDTRHKVYGFLEQGICIALFYSIVAATIIYTIVRFRSMAGRGKVVALLFAWVMAGLLLLIPLWFQNQLLVLNDRYTYFTDAFFYMLVAVALSFITIPYVYVALVSLFALLNLRFTIKVNRYWGKSARVIHGLLHNIPDEQNKTILLLNLPQSMHGIAMIGAEKNSEYKLMHDLLLPDKLLRPTVYDVLAYNMETPEDGAHVNVINDSTIHVILNQWGTWWWFETKGGYSYENSDYKLDLKDPGHWYELILKKPAQQYLMLYSVGAQWKAVDMGKKDVEQH